MKIVNSLSKKCNKRKRVNVNAIIVDVEMVVSVIIENSDYSLFCLQFI